MSQLTRQLMRGQLRDDGRYLPTRVLPAPSNIPVSLAVVDPPVSAMADIDQRAAPRRIPPILQAPREIMEAGRSICAPPGDHHGYRPRPARPAGAACPQ